ncbi:MAG: outer membrane beta-barrel protein [Flavobacteriaceae bacterium]|nr:outer membrane beta-barrel protein [Flavobacteriaceae bacterium]
MKKICLSVLVLTFLWTSDSNAQSGLSIGGGVTIPIGEATNFSSVGFMLDVNYLFEISESVDVGLASGFVNVFGKEEKRALITIDHDDFKYIPLAAAARVTLTNNMVVGVDLGYAIAVSDNWDGGFSYRPIFGYNFSDKFQVNTSYTGISDSNFTWNTWNFGVMFNL